VTVRDTTPPAITLLGDTPIIVEQNDPYTDAGATALDAVDGNLTASITETWSEPVNTAVAGDYTVTYRATDKAGNVGAAVRTVTVVAALPLLAPSNLTALVENIGRGRNKTKNVTLTWTDNSSNELGFYIERCEETGKGRNKTCNFDNSVFASVGVGVTTYPDTDVAGKFHYRVKAYNAQDSSAYSNEVKI
jgi:hypothetical protein